MYIVSPRRFQTKLMKTATTYLRLKICPLVGNAKERLLSSPNLIIDKNRYRKKVDYLHNIIYIALKKVFLFLFKLYS